MKPLRTKFLQTLSVVQTHDPGKQNPPTHRDERVEHLAFLPTFLSSLLPFFPSSFFLFFLSSEPLSPQGGGLPPPLTLPRKTPPKRLEVFGGPRMICFCMTFRSIQKPIAISNKSKSEAKGIPREARARSGTNWKTNIQIW